MGQGQRRVRGNCGGQGGVRRGLAEVWQPGSARLPLAAAAGRRCRVPFSTPSAPMLLSSSAPRRSPRQPLRLLRVCSGSGSLLASVIDQGKR
ncbi:hypothetical protein NDU88_001707 [Pleurodeles waltl]|uniref:Uncharacterized protein n=1 Tax=Pleurodeles waltl TaxID=8319 RepID=A0AAV7SZZ8_PLEWA|nr:hypothetical protein NDU88_001707 [Pleurodeles waltl]